MNLATTDITYMFVSILAGIVLTLVTCWLSMLLARKMNLLDVPGSEPHKKHTHPVPLSGGIAIIISVIILTAVTGLWKEKEILFSVLGAVVIFGFGLADDFHHLNPLMKIAGQILGAVIIILGGISIQVLEAPVFYLGGPVVLYAILDKILTLFWIVGITNSVNLIDSMDGLAVGIAAWAFAFFMLAMYGAQQYSLSMESALLIGVCVSVYLFNSQPARLFLGDSGAQTLGFLLAVFSIIYNPLDKTQTSSWFVPILLLGVPIFDTSLVTLSRFRRKKPFYKGDLTHTYHRLVVFGLHPNQAVMTMHITALALDSIAIIAVSLAPVYANSIFGLCLAAGVILYFVMDNKTRFP